MIQLFLKWCYFPLLFTKSLWQMLIVAGSSCDLLSQTPLLEVSIIKDVKKLSKLVFVLQCILLLVPSTQHSTVPPPANSTMLQISLKESAVCSILSSSSVILADFGVAFEYEAKNSTLFFLILVARNLLFEKKLFDQHIHTY